MKFKNEKKNTNAMIRRGNDDRTAAMLNYRYNL